MVRYSQTLRDCLLRYPLIFPNALTVAEHLFLVTGNGYEWSEGCLVDSNSSVKRVLTKEEAIEKIVTHELSDDNPGIEISKRLIKVMSPDNFDDEFNRFLKHTSGTILYQIRLVHAVEKRERDFDDPRKNELYVDYNKFLRATNERFTLYGLNEYSKICSLPDDIQPDWLDAADRMLEFCIENKDMFRNAEEGELDVLLKKASDRVSYLKKKLNNKIV